jgi:hypothetical protein
MSNLLPAILCLYGIGIMPAVALLHESYSPDDKSLFLGMVWPITLLLLLLKPRIKLGQIVRVKIHSFFF